MSRVGPWLLGEWEFRRERADGPPWTRAWEPFAVNGEHIWLRRRVGGQWPWAVTWALAAPVGFGLSWAIGSAV